MGASAPERNYLRCAAEEGCQRVSRALPPCYRRRLRTPFGLGFGFPQRDLAEGRFVCAAAARLLAREQPWGFGRAVTRDPLDLPAGSGAGAEACVCPPSTPPPLADDEPTGSGDTNNSSGHPSGSLDPVGVTIGSPDFASFDFPAFGSSFFGSSFGSSTLCSSSLTFNVAAVLVTIETSFVNTARYS